MSVEPIENIKDESYFEPEMLRTSLENSEPYIKLVGKKFHNFKIIEIISETEAKEHFTFLHPYYNG